ncbi:MAG: hypothetical protein WDW38_005533 [Sanguina aurantia]
MACSPSSCCCSEYLRLSPAVAGATLLAFGNGAPDLFTQLAAIQTGTEDTSGEGVSMAISEPLGSGLFVGTVAFAAVILGARAHKITLKRAFFLKDILFYLGAAVLVMVCLVEGQVDLWQCLLLAAYYAVYVCLTIWMSHTEGDDAVRTEPMQHEVPHLPSDSSSDEEEGEEAGTEGPVGRPSLEELRSEHARLLFTTKARVSDTGVVNRRTIISRRSNSFNARASASWSSLPHLMAKPILEDGSDGGEDLRSNSVDPAVLKQILLDRGGSSAEQPQSPQSPQRQQASHTISSSGEREQSTSVATVLHLGRSRQLKPAPGLSVARAQSLGSSDLRRRSLDLTADPGPPVEAERSDLGPPDPYLSQGCRVPDPTGGSRELPPVDCATSAQQDSRPSPPSPLPPEAQGNGGPEPHDGPAHPITLQGRSVAPPPFTPSPAVQRPPPTRQHPSHPPTRPKPHGTQVTPLAPLVATPPCLPHPSSPVPAPLSSPNEPRGTPSRFSQTPHAHTSSHSQHPPPAASRSGTGEPQQRHPACPQLPTSHTRSPFSNPSQQQPRNPTRALPAHNRSTAPSPAAAPPPDSNTIRSPPVQQARRTPPPPPHPESSGSRHTPDRLPMDTSSYLHPYPDDAPQHLHPTPSCHPAASPHTTDTSSCLHPHPQATVPHAHQLPGYFSNTPSGRGRGEGTSCFGDEGMSCVSADEYSEDGVDEEGRLTERLLQAGWRPNTHHGRTLRNAIRRSRRLKRNVERPLMTLLSFTMPRINIHGRTRYSKVNAVLLPVTVPLLVALYNKWLPGPADRLNLVIVVLPCVIACAVTLLLYPKNGRLRGPGSRSESEGCTCTLLAFLMSMAWMDVAANELVNLAQALGTIWDCRPALLSSTLLSWGNSLPDLISNYSLSRDGYPTMAVTACFASPIFTLLMGMAVSLTYEAWDKPLLLSNDFSLKVLNGSIMVMLLIWALLVPLFFRYTLDRRTACIALILYLVALTCIIVAG